MTRSHKEGPVKSHLERLIGRYGRQESLAVGRVRRWVSTMALLGALERVEQSGGEPRFVLKGGVAIELRLRAGARATQDVDMIFRGPRAELIEALDVAFSESYRDFAFERGAPVYQGPHATASTSAREVGVGVVDVDVAADDVRAFIAVIADADLAPA